MGSWKAGAKLLDALCHYETGFSKITLSEKGCVWGELIDIQICSFMG